jgi:hypothetical protein
MIGIHSLCCPFTTAEIDKSIANAVNQYRRMKMLQLGSDL